MKIKLTLIVALISTITFSQEMLLKKDVVKQKFGKIMFYRYKIVEKVEKNDNGSVTDQKGKPLDGHCNIADTRGNYIDVHFKKGKKHGEEVKYDYNNRKLSMISYVNGKKVGKYESYFTDGNVRVRGKYADGFQNDKWEYFNKSGKLESYETYKNGRKEGDFWKKKRSSNGYYTVKGSYKNDTPVGVWIEKWEEGKEKQRITYTGKGTYTKKTYYTTGELKDQESYVDFKRHGEQLSYSKSKVLLERTNYINGLVVKQESFFDTGRPRKMYSQKNGKPHGKFVDYNRNGTKRLEGEYNEGNKTGLWKTYTGDEGVLSYEVHYKDDIVDGIKKAYNYKGNLKYEGNNVKGKKDGLWVWYNNDGKVTKEITYNLGKEISGIYKSYHSNGVLREVENYKNSKLNGVQYRYSRAKVLINKRTYEKGELLKEESFFDTGRPYKVYNKKNNKYHGKFIIYAQSGAKEKEGEYVNGNKTGLWKRYIGKDGWLKEELNFKNDIENGLHKVYYSSGSVELQGVYLNGKRNGTWKWYNQRGKVTKESEYKDGIEVSSKTFN